MKIYTKTGDAGETGLLGGVRVAKDHQVIEVCGELDETNSLLGLARSYGLDAGLDELLGTIQEDLFVIGSQVAGCAGQSKKPVNLPEGRIAWLEKAIDKCCESLPPMDAFILPGGHRSAATLHVARSVCRRAERRLVSLIATGEPKIDLGEAMVYLNRVGDLLFVMGRSANAQNNVEDVKWIPAS